MDFTLEVSIPSKSGWAAQSEIYYDRSEDDDRELTMNDIKQMWSELQNTFPTEATELNINGIALKETNRLVCDCINEFIFNNGKLTAETIKMLPPCKVELQKVIPHIKGETQAYFAKLYRLCDVISSRVVNV